MPPKILARLGAVSLLAFGALTPPTSADTVIEIQPRPLVIDGSRLRGTPPERWDTQAQRLAQDWVEQYGRAVPVLHATGEDSDDDSWEIQASNSQGDTAGPAVLSKLIVQIMNFARDVQSQSDGFESDFHSQFLHALSAHAPGFAWVVVAERTGFDLEWMDGYREGGGAGVQIPLLGSRDLWLRNGQGQVVLKLMPIAGNYEMVDVGTNPLNRVGDPRGGLVLRPMAELEASYQAHGVQPGIRFLVQPKLMSPRETRMVAEVYMNIDLKTRDSGITDVSIVPRCVLDLSSDRQAATGAYAGGYYLLNRAATCSISSQFAFGN
jgi:hypothetical protein